MIVNVRLNILSLKHLFSRTPTRWHY